MKLFVTCSFCVIISFFGLLVLPCIAIQDSPDPSLLDPAARKMLESFSQSEKKIIEKTGHKNEVIESEVGRTQTQKEWMINLVDACGWSFGLPDNPQIEDYLTILSGNRLLRIEAEESKQKLDSVSVKNFSTYGRFSGSGWVSGLASPTKIHMKFLVPLSGKYQLTASLRLAGFRFNIGGQVLTASGGQSFKRIEMGEVELQAGPQEVVVDIPPNASIDYIELAGGQERRIAPPGGWQADAPLTEDVIASTALQVLGFEYLLPFVDDEVLLEAEVANNIDRAKVVTSRHLGVPSGGKWLRAGAVKARIEFPIAIAQEGIYKVSLRAASSSPITVTVNGRFDNVINFPSYLDFRMIGAFRLSPGNNRVSIDLPPRAGIDLISIRRLSDSGQAYRQLAGILEGNESLRDVANDVLQLLATIGMPR